MDYRSAPAGVPLFAVKHIDIHDLMTRGDSIIPRIHRGEIVKSKDFKNPSCFSPYNKNGELSNNKFCEYKYAYFPTAEQAYEFAIEERRRVVQDFYEQKMGEIDKYFSAYNSYDDFLENKLF